MNADCVLEGKKVRLRPVREDDLPHFVRWLNDPDVLQWLTVPKPPTMDEERQWWEAEQNNPHDIVWAIEALDGRLLGDTALRPNPLGRWADLGIFIGEKGAWSRGYGADAIRTILRYAFAGMRLNRVSLTADELNARALRCYEKCGFVREGLMRQHRVVDGQFRNTVMMGILREEFLEGASATAP
jgi:RimJ/RimL family protein N-acetyltransferase